MSLGISSTLQLLDASLWFQSTCYGYLASATAILWSQPVSSRTSWHYISSLIFTLPFTKGPVWRCDRLVSRAKVLENQVMAALVISISLDVSVESVGSTFLRVFLIGSIYVEVSVAPKVGAAAVASPVGVLELDTYSSSEADPSESSPPPVSIAPMVSPFMCLEDSESDIEIPERHEDILIGLLYRTYLGGPCKALTTRKLVRPLPAHRLALRYTSRHLDHFTIGSSLSHSFSDHSSSGHSSSGHSLSGHTPPDTTDADSSTP
nr:hypothetical protein [Tanacetum cinerariifolium]